MSISISISIYSYIHTSVQPYINVSLFISIQPYIHTSVRPYPCDLSRKYRKEEPWWTVLKAPIARGHGRIAKPQHASNVNRAGLGRAFTGDYSKQNNTVGEAAIIVYNTPAAVSLWLDPARAYFSTCLGIPPPPHPPTPHSKQ